VKRERRTERFLKKLGGARGLGGPREPGGPRGLFAVVALMTAILLLCCSTCLAADKQTKNEPTGQATEKSGVKASEKTPAAQTPVAKPPSAQQPSQAPAQQPTAPQAPPSNLQTIQLIRAEVALDSLNPRLHYQLGNALHEADDKDGALLEYEKAISLKPNFKEALVNKGAVLNEMGRVTDAIDVFKKALAIDPKDTKALVNYGNSLYAMQLYEQATKQYELAIAVDSTFGEGYYYLGIAFADAGIYREAVREWELILKVAPNSEAAKTARDNIDTLKNYMTTDVKPGTKPRLE